MRLDKPPVFALSAKSKRTEDSDGLGTERPRSPYRVPGHWRQNVDPRAEGKLFKWMMRFGVRATRTTEVLTVTIPQSWGSTTILSLTRSTPTSSATATSEHSTRLSDSAIGAIVGSLLGALVLGLLLYSCCCRTGSEKSFDESDSDPSSREVVTHQEIPLRDTIGTKQPHSVEVREDLAVWTRPARRSHSVATKKDSHFFIRRRRMERAPIMNE